MSRLDEIAPELRVGFPRVSGDEPLRERDTGHVFQFSPRERG